MKKNKTTSVFVVSVCVLIGLTGGLFWLVKSLQDRNQAVVEERAQLENEVALMRSMQQVRRSVLSSQEEQQELAAFFVSEDQIPRFLGTLEAIARQSNVSMKISRVSLINDRQELQVSVRLTGEFASLHQYIEAVEYSPFRLEITRLLMRHESSPQPDVQTDPWVLELELVLQSYSEVEVPDISPRES